MRFLTHRVAEKKEKMIGGKYKNSTQCNWCVCVRERETVTERERERERLLLQ